MSTTQSFDGYSPTWCPGCGDWGIGASIKSALLKMGMTPSDLIAVFGIGCSGNMNDFLNAYGLHALHGRAIPNAIGAKLANHKMTVVAVVGDGDCYGEGGNHFMHACRGNHDITVIVHDNGVYGLTKGQTAPTSPEGYVSSSTPLGNPDRSLNPLSLAIVSGATFVSQSFAGNVPHMVDTIQKAIAHRGFSVVNILQPCVTFNKINTYKYYLEHAFKLPETHQRDNIKAALDAALMIESEKFPLGVLYEVSRPAFHEHFLQLKDKTLLEKEPFSNLESLLKNFR